MNDAIEMLIKRFNNLEKKIEKYYNILFMENELDFVFNGTYLLETDLEEIMSGNYTLNN